MKKLESLLDGKGWLPALFLFLAVSGVAQAETQKGTPTPEPAEFIIEDLHGSNVQVLEEGETKWEAAVEGQVVDSGDEVKVGAASEVSLMLENETTVHLAENSDLKIGKVGSNESGGFFSRLKILTGRLLADVKKNLRESQSSFEVESNGVVCGVRGTAFEVNADGEETQVSTHEGEVEVSGEGEAHKVSAGNLSIFKKRRFQLLRRLDRMDHQRFQKWRVFRTAVRQKRLQRVLAIRNHQLKPWHRLHPRLNQGDRILPQELKKKKLRKTLHGRH